MHLAYDLADGYESAIIIDAAPRGANPGTVTVTDVERERQHPAAPGGALAGSRLFDAHGMQPDVVLRVLDPPGGSVVVIENVGNLVCPALFDLGEAYRVVFASVTEGADKPAKYPHMFRSADLVLVTKTDLLPYLEFDLGRCAADIQRVSPGAQILPISARAGDGVGAWHGWLRDRTGARPG